MSPQQAKTPSSSFHQVSLAPNSPESPSGRGLTSTQAAQRLAQDGPNELPQSHQKGPWRLLGEVVCEPMFVLLMGCGLVYMALGDHDEAWILLGFVLAIVALTFFQQSRTDHALEALMLQLQVWPCRCYWP